jgi:hypothetical protein
MEAETAMVDAKVDAYVGRQKSHQKEVCQELRALIHRTLPEVKEEMRWGVPTFDDGKFYIVALKDHVNLGFSISGLLPGEMRLLGGSGKTMKHLEIGDPKDIDEKKIAQLLTLVHSRR